MDKLKEDDHQLKDDRKIAIRAGYSAISKNRIYILKIISIFFVISLLLAFGSQKEYRSEVKILVLEKNSTNVSGLLSQFSGLAGLNLGSMQSDELLSPDIYPDIIQSTPFLLEVLNETIYVKKLDRKLLVHEFLLKENPPSFLKNVLRYTIQLPFTLFNSTKKDSIRQHSFQKSDSSFLRISDYYDKALIEIKQRIQIKKGEIPSLISISVEMPDANASAELSTLVVSLLKEYSINYRLQKVNSDLDFVSNQHQQAKQKFLVSQSRLAEFRDANLNINKAGAKSEEERLLSDYNLSFNIYNGLSQQVEQTKLKVQENTPIFKIIEPSHVPNSTSKPKKSIIIVGFIFFGLVYSIFSILFKNYKKQIFNDI